MIYSSIKNNKDITATKHRKTAYVSLNISGQAHIRLERVMPPIQ